MSLKLGDTFPNLSMKTTWGNLNLYDYLGESWVIENNRLSRHIFSRVFFSRTQLITRQFAQPSSELQQSTHQSSKI